MVRKYLRRRNLYQEVFAEIRRILVDRFGIDPLQVRPKTDWAALKADGVERVELMVEAEHSFEIIIREEAEHSFRTLHDLVEHVAQLKHKDLNQTQFRA